MVGVVAALPAEARALIGRTPRPGERIQAGERTLIQLSGVGADRAGEAARSLLNSGARALVSWGSAAGLESALAPGRLLLPQSVLLSPQLTYRADPKWHRRCFQHLSHSMPVDTRPLAETSLLLNGSHQKACLHAQTGAIAADMESGTLAMAAGEAGVPFLVVRAVVDSLDMAVPRSAIAAVDEQGRLHLRRAIAALIQRPKECVSLLRLGLSFRAAQATLTRVAGMCGPGFLT